jgi:hypothetical protein
MAESDSNDIEQADQQEIKVGVESQINYLLQKHETKVNNQVAEAKQPKAEEHQAVQPPSEKSSAAQ